MEKITLKSGLRLDPFTNTIDLYEVNTRTPDCISITREEIPDVIHFLAKYLAEAEHKW